MSAIAAKPAATGPDDTDIEAAKLAVQKSKTQAVVDFANDMIRDHEAVNVQALELVKKLGVTPQDNATSQALGKAAADERARLSALDGALEGRLIPSAQNAELKNLPETGLKLFQGHQAHAEHVAAELK